MSNQRLETKTRKLPHSSDSSPSTTERLRGRNGQAPKVANEKLSAEIVEHLNDSLEQHHRLGELLAK